jgi:hypothetical protein
MTVPLEQVLADLPLERREAVLARSRELIQDNHQRQALRGILRYVEHQDKPGKDDRGNSKPLPKPHYDVFLGTQRVASIRDLTDAGKANAWRAFFYVQWAEAVCLDEYDLQDCKDRLETAILQWLNRMQVMPTGNIVISTKSAENS